MMTGIKHWGPGLYSILSLVLDFPDSGIFRRHWANIVSSLRELSCVVINSKEPKSVTSFNQLTFYHAEINQSEVEVSFQLASDWIKSAQKNVNKLKWAFCCKG